MTDFSCNGPKTYTEKFINVKLFISMYSLFSPIFFRTFIIRSVDNNINKIFPIKLRSDCLKVVVLHSNRSVSSLYLNEYDVSCHSTPYKILSHDNKKASPIAKHVYSQQQKTSCMCWSVLNNTKMRVTEEIQFWTFLRSDNIFKEKFQITHSKYKKWQWRPNQMEIS